MKKVKSMSEIILPAKPHKLLKVFNILSMLINLWMAFLLCVMLIMMREGFVEPHMESSLPDFLLQKKFIAFPALFTVGMIIKEFKIQPLMKRLYINLLIMAGLFIHMGLLQYLPYL